jgi:hypothetical protein
MKMQVRVLGVTRFNDLIEGKKYDQTKLKVEMAMSERSGNSMGSDAIDMVYGTSANFEVLQKSGAKFPCMCDLEVNPTTKGFEVEFCKPVIQGAQAKAA